MTMPNNPYAGTTERLAHVAACGPVAFDPNLDPVLIDDGLVEFYDGSTDTVDATSRGIASITAHQWANGF